MSNEHCDLWLQATLPCKTVLLHTRVLDISFRGGFPSASPAICLIYIYRYEYLYVKYHTGSRNDMRTVMFCFSAAPAEGGAGIFHFELSLLA